jgi:DNA-binding PadR family transcriptional regulator
VVLHDVLHRFEQAGLLSSTRDGAGRRYRLTSAGRARLRFERRLRVALARVLLRGSSSATGVGSTGGGCRRADPKR